MAEIKDLHAYAKTFPSQGGVEIGEWLQRYAAAVPAGAAIVELGCWLGGGTAHLALGAMKSNAPIYTYDRFFCPNDEEKDKAARYGITLKIGENTLPRVTESLKPFGVNITYRKGSFHAFEWPEKFPIALYVDDLTKSDDKWLPAMKTFFPHFVAGTTHLFLMDYHFDESAGPHYAAQKRWMAGPEGKRFELLENRLAGTTCALFRFLG